MWMKLAGMDLTAEDVIERGGIVQTLRGGTPKSATVADLPDSNLGRDLAEAEASIADTKGDGKRYTPKRTGNESEREGSNEHGQRDSFENGTYEAIGPKAGN